MITTNADPICITIILTNFKTQWLKKTRLKRKQTEENFANDPSNSANRHGPIKVFVYTIQIGPTSTPATRPSTACRTGPWRGRSCTSAAIRLTSKTRSTATSSTSSAATTSPARGGPSSLATPDVSDRRPLTVASPPPWTRPWSHTRTCWRMTSLFRTMPHIKNYTSWHKICSRTFLMK